ncbi:hypothetical protein GGF31_006188 [Allomyces arbusculus]|nr:hypothetical protein GGF31_006188 [Allomyces arbusculus]
MAATADLLTLPGNRRRFMLVVSAHRDVTTGPWSMDLVRAVRRQRRFSSTMTEHVVLRGCGAIHATVTEALVQYPKFLAMMAIRPKCALVPTTTIDLAWHTHQLTPSAYAAHTRALTGQIANHDDSDDVETEAAIADGAKAMPDAWRAVFDEDYYCPNVRAGGFKCFLKSPCLYEQTVAKDAQCLLKLPCTFAQVTMNDPAAPGKTTHAESAEYCAFSHCFIGTHCTLAATDKTATEAVWCHRNGKCMVGAIRSNDAQAAQVAYCWRSGWCYVPVRPNDAHTAEVASCFRNDKCTEGP